MTFRGVFLGYAATRDAVLPLKKIVFVVRSKKKKTQRTSLHHTTYYYYLYYYLFLFAVGCTIIAR